MDLEHMNIAIVGHVDHGKSTLTGRLFYDTGCLADEKLEEIKKICRELGRDFEFAYAVDHLQEEREDEMTIDTAQTFFKTAKRRYVIIDTPGHKEFMKNMITGTSQAEAAVLIVDAKQGVEEQTKRHAYVLAMLGVKQLIVVVNKMDLVAYSQEAFNQLKESILKFLETLKLKPSYVIPISARNGDNVAKPSNSMKWYRGKTVLQALDCFESQEEGVKKGLRFPVQDIYNIKGKRIVVGRVEHGIIRKGDAILILPDGVEAKVNSIEVFMGAKESVETGESVGITLEDASKVERGCVICTRDDQPKLTDNFNADVFWMSEQPLTVGETVTLKLSTEESEAVIEKLNRKIDSSSLEEIKESMNELKETEVGVASIKTSKPLLVDGFNHIPSLGRFVLVRNNDIAAGGIIV